MTGPELRPELLRTIEHLAGRWVRADTQVLKHAFPLLAEGRPVPVNRLGQAASATSVSVNRALDASRVARDDNGDIVEVFGVTLRPTLHRVELGQTALFTCCALVAHVLPRLFGRQLAVRSEDPVTGDIVRFAITPAGVSQVEPETAVASMIATDKSDVQENAPLHFCRHVHHFRSSKTANTFAAGNASRYVVTLSELDAAAQRVYSVVWG